MCVLDTRDRSIGGEVVAITLGGALELSRVAGRGFCKKWKVDKPTSSDGAPLYNKKTTGRKDRSQIVSI